MNRKIFFDSIKNDFFAGRLLQGQVDGINNILDEWEKRKLTDLRWLSYMLATVYHETAKMMQPVREMGGEAYLKKKPYYPWVGEGLVQVTWEENHRRFGATKPGQLLTWPIALKALFDGMIKGMFTGKKLSHYFNETKEDWINARRIINILDKAELIAGYGNRFYKALKQARMPLTKIDIDILEIEDLGHGDFRIKFHYDGNPQDVTDNLHEEEKTSIEVPSHAPPP